MLGIHVDGGLADHVVVPAVVVPANALLPRPLAVSTLDAATAVDARATAYHAITRRAAVQEGETVLVIGAGGLGSYGIQFARVASAGAMIGADTDRVALERASDLGADDTVLVEQVLSTGRAVKHLTDGGVDAAIEFVGYADSVTDAIKLIRPGGRAVVVGVGIEPITTLLSFLRSNNEYVLIGSYGRMPGDAAAILDLLADEMVTAPTTFEASLDEAPAILLGIADGSETWRGRPIMTP